MVHDIMLSPVLNGDQFFGVYRTAGFFKNFLLGVGCDGLIHIAPSTGERPGSVIFMDKKDFPINKNCRTGINFRGLIAAFIAE